MLAVITVLAVVFLIVSRAAQGSAWAVGVSAAVMMLAVVAIVHLGLFFLIWLVSLVSLRSRGKAIPAEAIPKGAESPFQSISARALPDGSNQPPA
jgi:hypothetical protein